MKIRLHTDFHSRPPRIFQRQKDGSWYIRQQINKREYWRSLHTSNKKLAEQLSYKIWYHQQGQTLRGILETPLEPLEEAMLQYQTTEAWTNLEDSTRDTKEKIWKSFMLWASGRGLEHVQDITPENGEMFLNTRGKTNKTFNNLLNDLRKTFGEICRLTHFENPFEKIQPRSIRKGDKASGEFRAFTDGEITAMLKYIPSSRMDFRSEWLIACEIARYTGLRYKDVALLEWGKIIDDCTFIETVPYKTKNSTGKAVIIRLVPPLVDLFQNRRKTSFYVLPGLASKYDEQHGTDAFTAMLKINKITAEPPMRVGFHSFRSTVTTKAQLAHIDLEDFGGVLGHASKSQTEHYNKAAIELDLSFLVS